MDQGAVKNLEQIQEHDDAPGMPRAASVALVVIGGAAVAFCVLAMGGRKSTTNEKRPDPLGDLVAQHAAGSAGATLTTTKGATQLSAQDVTFPGILSDDGKPTTALAAVRTAPQPVILNPHAPPPAGDRLPVVTFAHGTPPVPAAAPPPLMPAPQEQIPAQAVLEATPIVTRPRDALTKAAADSAQITTPTASTTAAGHEGGYQLQVSSFKSEKEAESFAEQLRARGHKAYIVEARVAGRGTWWRVRVGPFSTQHAAAAYRQSFEAKEHVVPFLVMPPKKGESHEQNRE